MRLNRKILYLLLLCLWFWLPTGCAASQPQLSDVQTAGGLDEARRAEIDAQVKEMLAESAVAWSAGDLDRFMEDYAPDCIFVSPGQVTEGRDAVHERYKARYPNREAMGKLMINVFDLRVLGPNAASAALGWRLEPAGGAAVLTGLSVVVVARSDGDRWQIVHDISM